MLWGLLALPAALLVLPRLSRGWSRRLGPVTVEPFPSVQLEISRNRSRRTKAALDAATRLLR